jgi:hypothetical protein
MWLSGGESGQGRYDHFIAVEDGSRVIRGGWPRKRDMVRRHVDVSQRRCDIGEGKGRRRRQLG